MSNYTKATNFATKDTLPTGDSGKIVKGTEIDTEFNAISSAISSKADTASPTFTGTPAAPTAASGTSTTQIATTAFVAGAVTDERTAAATLTNKTITSPIINQIVHEGTDDDYETTLAFTDPTADRTITFPDKSGTVAMAADIPSAAALYTSSGTYAIAGSTTLTVTSNSHGRAVNDVVYLNFTSGTAVDGYFTITAVTDNTFTVTYGSSITTSGNVTGYYSNPGLMSIASSEEVLAGISTTRAATPAGVQAVLGTRFVRETAQATTSGTDFTFGSIPSWVKRITIMISGMSITGSDEIILQIGTSGGFLTSGYVGNTNAFNSSPSSSGYTNGYILAENTDATNTISVLATLVNITGNTWVFASNQGNSATIAGFGCGTATLGGTLTQLKVLLSGSNTFDAGSLNIMYE